MTNTTVETTKYMNWCRWAYFIDGDDDKEKKVLWCKLKNGEDELTEFTQGENSKITKIIPKERQHIYTEDEHIWSDPQPLNQWRELYD